MNCPKCGAKMESGKLYCPNCGEEIKIVPDFEPELEYNMEQTLHDIVKDIHVGASEHNEQKEQDLVESEENIFCQDWDEPEDFFKEHRKLAGYNSRVLLYASLGVYP